MKAILLAAGRGERLRPLTESIPKPLLTVGKYRLIDYHLYALARVGITEVIINVSHHAAHIMDALGDGSRYGVSIQYSHEGDVPLETGGGIYHALPLLGDEPFLVVSSDIWTDYPFQQLRSYPLKALAHLVMVDNPAYHPRGDFFLDQGRIFLHGEPKLNYGNIGLYHPRFFAQATPGTFPLVTPLCRAIEQGSVTGDYYSGQWFNIGAAAQLVSLRQRNAVMHV